MGVVLKSISSRSMVGKILNVFEHNTYALHSENDIGEEREEVINPI